MDQREHKITWAVVLVVLCVHILSFVYLSHLAAGNSQALPYPVIAGDSRAYAELADTLLTHHAFSSSPDLTPQREWAPGYAAFIAGVKALTGSFTLAVVIQTALTLCAVILVYLITRRFVPPTFAALAAVLYGIDPMVVLTNTTILTDGFFAALLVFIIYLGFFSPRLRTSVRWGVIGVLLGIAVMLRPIGQYLIILLPAAYLVREWLRGWENREKHIALALCAYVLCVSAIVVPWIIRNERLFGSFEIAHNSAGVLLGYDVRNFLVWREMGESPTSVLYPVRHPYSPQYVDAGNTIDAYLSEITPPGQPQDNYDVKAALHFIAQDPLGYLYFHVANTLPFFLAGSWSEYQQIAAQEGSNTDFSASTLTAAIQAIHELRTAFWSALTTLLPVVLETAFLLCVWLLALCGFLYEWRRFEVWLFAGLVGYFALLTGPLSLARYRIPALPFLLMLAAIGAYGLARRLGFFKIFHQTVQR